MKPLTIMRQPRLKRPSAGWGAGAMMVASAWTIFPLAGAGPHVFVLAGACAKRTILSRVARSTSSGSPRAFLLGGSGALDGLRHEVLLRVEGRFALRTETGTQRPRAVELAGLHVVAQLVGHVVTHHGAASGVEDGIGDLDTVLGVARHHVGAGQVHRIRLLAERVDARVLQEAPTIERMCTLSVLPSIPGSMHEMPRMIMSTRTPTRLASAILSITSRSVREFILKKACAGHARRVHGRSRGRGRP